MSSKWLERLDSLRIFRIILTVSKSLNCLAEKPLPVYGTGENVRDWLYVQDHCDAINLVLQKGIVGETYNVGGNNEIPNIQIVRDICTILDEVEPAESGNSYHQLITFEEAQVNLSFFMSSALLFQQ